MTELVAALGGLLGGVLLALPRVIKAISDALEHRDNYRWRQCLARMKRLESAIGTAEIGDAMVEFHISPELAAIEAAFLYLDAQVVIWVVCTEGEIVAAAGHSEILGHKLDDVIGERWFDKRFIADEDRAQTSRIVAKTALGKVDGERLRILSVTGIPLNAKLWSTRPRNRGDSAYRLFVLAFEGD